jgi:copper homeostasis protein
MIRPRVGDFIYTKEELEVMIEDIRIFKALDVKGVVFGVLDSAHAVNVSDTKTLDALCHVIVSC